MSNNKVNILIADDEILNVKIIEKFLLDSGYNVLTASDGFEALEIIKSNEIDLILLDIQMPELDGFETSKKIKSLEKYSEIPIIFLTASTKEEDLTKAFSIGAVDYINKPIIKVELLSRINIHLKLYSYQHDLKNIIKEQTSIIKEKSEALIEKLYIDENTGLKNLLALQEEIESRKNDWLFLLDINDFNVINKLYGFKFGDVVLQKISSLLKEILSSKVTIFKLPSDRFAIIIPKNDFSALDIEAKCEKIFSFFDINEIVLDTIISLKINFNIGVTVIKDSNTIIEAEYALDLSKRLGKRNYFLMTENNDYLENEKDQLYSLFKTRRYIENDLIVPFFQPIVDAKTKEIYKYEALARVIDNGEIIPPFKFLDAAVKLGLMQNITKTIIKKSCKIFENSKIGFSINFTDRDLVDKSVIDTLVNSAKEFNIDNTQITIEILENITLIDNSNDTVFSSISNLKDLGFQIAIDDFGSESSNFSRIIHLKADYLKIDGIFIKDIKNDKNKQNITLSIIQLAQNLGIKSVAEFVSDEETYNILKDFGVDYVQGFYFGKPEEK